MADKTIGGMLLRRIRDNAGDEALRYKDGAAWKSVTWKALGERMERIAAGLITAPGGLEQGAAIAVLGNTSYDWIACDFAAMTIGIRTVPVYATLLPEEVGYLHTDTEAVISIVENKEQLEKVRGMRDGFEFFEKQYDKDLVKVRHIVVMDTTGVEPADDWESLADLEKRGEGALAELKEKMQAWGDAATRDNTCTYTYTSGTTGPPKGVIQTNHNMLSMVENIEATGMFRREVAEGGLFLFLPLAHSFGRLIEHAGPFFNSPIIISSVPTLLDDLLATQPGFFPAAPRVYEKMKAKIETKVAGAPPVRQKLFHWAVDAGKATIPFRSAGRPVPFFAGLKYGIADKLVLSKLRAALGFSNAKILLSGSAPLGVDVHEFFLAMGLDLLEGYGLTETCPALTACLPGKIKLGTVGLPLPGVEIKIAPDGEILAKGANVTSGYLNREDATSEAFDDDGWFCTGDLGAQDDEGFVRITGRKKELMKTSGGKYIAPAKIEARLKSLPMIQEAVTVADTRNYATALIAIDPEALEDWAKQQGVAPDPQGDAVKNAVQKHVDGVNETLAKYETIKYFRIIDPLTVESGLLTASLKVKRKPTYDRYADLINEMYAS
jgi:long-chain acyl-CoA synthetase